MSFLQIKKQTIYLQVTNNPKLIRPLFTESEGRWVHNIPSCSRQTPGGKKENLRYYRQVDASFSSWMKDNPDPLWDLLDQQDKHDREGNRQDFNVRPVHLCPVWDYEEQDIKIAKFGNQFFDEMTKWYDQGGNVTECDWMCWTEGNGRRVSYKTSRQDKTGFNFQGDMKALQVKCQEMIAKATNDLTPFKTEEDMLKFIRGEKQQEATSFNYGHNQQSQQPQQPQQNQLPGYVPGGQSAAVHGSVPASLPPASPMPSAQPQATAQTMPQQAVPQTTPQAVPQATAQTMPQATAQTMPQATAQTMPQATPVGFMAQPAAPQAGYTPAPPAGQGYVPQVPAQPGVPVTVPPVQEEVPNAPVQSQPVFAPPVQTQAMPQVAMPAQAPAQQAPISASAQQAMPQQQSLPVGGPADMVIDFGKHEGKTLGWVLENDRTYLTFLKGNKKEQYAAPIEALLGTTSVAQVATPAAVPATSAAPAGDAERAQVLDRINQKFLNIPDFQGPGIASSMMPFLREIIGTTDFATVPTADLLRLEAAVDQRISSQG